MHHDWFLAAEHGKIEVLSELLGRGVLVDARGPYRQTALVLATAGRHIETVEALLSHGADPNVQDKHDWTAMTWAAVHARGWQIVAGRCWPTLPPDMRLLELLTAAGGRLSLREAIVLGDVELARRFCDAGDCPDLNGEAMFGMHETYLMLAAGLGPLAMVDLLLDRGADIEGTDDIGHTALMRAAELGQVAIVARLLDRGADINWGWPDATAFTIASDYGQEAVVSLLLSRGAKPSRSWRAEDWL